MRYESVDLYFDNMHKPTIMFCDPEGCQDNSDKYTQIDIIADYLCCNFTLSLKELEELQNAISERLNNFKEKNESKSIRKQSYSTKKDNV